MLDQLVHLLGYDFVQNAIAAGVVIAIVSGVVSRFVVARSIVWIDREVRDGRWPQLELPARGSTELAGLRVGLLVNFGHQPLLEHERIVR